MCNIHCIIYYSFTDTICLPHSVEMCDTQNQLEWRIWSDLCLDVLLQKVKCMWLFWVQLRMMNVCMYECIRTIQHLCYVWMVVKSSTSLKICFQLSVYNGIVFAMYSRWPVSYIIVWYSLVSFDVLMFIKKIKSICSRWCLWNDVIQIFNWKLVPVISIFEIHTW